MVSDETNHNRRITMSTSYSHFTPSEREKILILRDRGISIRAMARMLGRAGSSISRELRRNLSVDGTYCAHEAESKYRQRRQRCVRKRRLDEPALRELVEEKLLDYWSPEQIDGRLKFEGSKHQVSYATIYRSIHRGMLKIPKRCLRRGGRGPSPHTEETRGRIHDHKTIHERPKSADKRSWFGHWEGDTVRGAAGKGVVATFVDRRSGFLVAALMPNRKAETLKDAMCHAFSGFPDSLKRSFTVDHGNEFFGYKDVEKKLETKIYFADPYSPWQRGLNENTNGLLRQYYPKKCDFLSVTAKQFKDVIASLNNRPRKRLGFRSPCECFPCRRVLHFT